MLCLASWGARLSGRSLAASSRISISVMIQSEASRPLERNPCCPAARPWILINVLLTCDEAIQPVFRFHLASEIIIFVRPQAPHWRTLFSGQMGKLSTHIYKRVACRHAYCFFEISLWEVIHQPIQPIWLYKRRFYDDFRHNSCSESLCSTPPSTQPRTTQRTLKRTLSENSKERL